MKKISRKEALAYGKSKNLKGAELEKFCKFVALRESGKSKKVALQKVQ